MYYICVYLCLSVSYILYPDIEPERRFYYLHFGTKKYKIMTTTPVTTSLPSVTNTATTTSMSKAVASIPATGGVRSLTVAYNVGWDLPHDEKIPSALIPMFEYPVARWALQVIRVLNSTGVNNYMGPALSKAVIPIILTRLPSELTELVPTTNLEVLLDFLLLFDSQRPSWRTFCSVTTANHRPSIAYVKAMTEMRYAWPGLTDIAYQRMAWDLLRQQLPDQLKFNYQVASITAPTNDELANLDNLWREIRAEKDHRSINFVGQSNERSSYIDPSMRYRASSVPPNYGASKEDPSRNDSLADRISSLETTVDRLARAFREPGFSPASKNFNSAGFSRAPSNAKHGLPPRSTHDKAGQCFYHAKFGSAALNCKAPCSYAADQVKVGNANSQGKGPNATAKN